MYLIGGAGEKTLCATVGTLSGVIIAGFTATVFSQLSGITGWNVSDIESLLTLYLSLIHIWKQQYGSGNSDLSESHVCRGLERGFCSSADYDRNYSYSNQGL